MKHRRRNLFLRSPTELHNASHDKNHSASVGRLVSMSSLPWYLRAFVPSCVKRATTNVMRPQSCKSKGRKFQQKITRSIVEAFDELANDDVRSTSMGAQGEDILLSPLARALLPLSIECKCVERLNVWQCLEQATVNAQLHDGATPCLVFSRNRSPTYAVLPWDCVLELYARARPTALTQIAATSSLTSPPPPPPPPPLAPPPQPPPQPPPPTSPLEPQRHIHQAGH